MIIVKFKMKIKLNYKMLIMKINQKFYLIKTKIAATWRMVKRLELAKLIKLIWMKLKVIIILISSIFCKVMIIKVIMIQIQI